MIKVQWSEKEVYDARVLFFGIHEETQKKEAEIISMLNDGKAKIEKETGIITYEEKKHEETATKTKKSKRKWINGNTTKINGKKIKAKEKRSSNKESKRMIFSITNDSGR